MTFEHNNSSSTEMYLKYLFMKRSKLIWASKLLLLLVLLFSASQNALASGLGGFAGASSRFTSDPIAAGTGGITLFQNSSTNSYTQNPTALAWFDNKSFDAGLTQLSLDRFIYSVNGSVPMPPTAHISMGLIAAGTNNIDARDSRGYYAGELSDTEMTYLLSFTNRFSDKLAIGVSLKLLSKQLSADEDWLDLKGSGFGAGIGVSYKPRPGSTFALAIKDWNSSYKWKTQDLFTHGSSYQDILPMSIAYGWQENLGSTTLAFEHDYYFFGENIYRLGLTWTGIRSLTLNTGFSYEDEVIIPGLSARYELSLKQGPPMHIDIGVRAGISGEGLRNYLGWGVNF